MTKDTKKYTNQQRLNKLASLKASSKTTSIRMLSKNPDSNRYKSYLNSYFCSEMQESLKTNIMQTYKCRQRWCVLCNKQRTAILMLKYCEALKQLNDVHFVTLTARIVNEKQLKPRLTEMQKIWRKITNYAQKDKIQLNGIRKTECVIAKNHPDKYHPHYHIIIEGKQNAEYIKKQWLKKWQNAYKTDRGIISIKAQSVLKSYGNIENSALEIFKYLTPMAHQHKTKKGLTTYKHDNPKMLDVIYNALHNSRSIQPFGNVKTLISTKTDEELIQESAETIKKPKRCKDSKYTYNHKKFNWISAYGEYLSTYKPKSTEYKKFLNDYPEQYEVKND